MPGPGPSNNLLAGFGLNTDPYANKFTPTSEQLQAWREIQQKRRLLDPQWQQNLDIPMAGMVGSIEGLLGVNPDPEGFTNADLAKLSPEERAKRSGNYGTQLLNQLSPMLGITRYTKGGQILKEARELGTQQFLNKMREMGPRTEEAASLFAERYPRVAAHIDPYELGTKASQRIKGRTDIGKYAPGAPQKTPVGLRADNPDVENTLLHEATHVAQELGNKDTSTLYGQATRAMSNKLGPEMAYRLNPFETSARRVAERKLGANLPPINAIKDLEHIIELLPPGDIDRTILASLLLSRK